MSSDAARASVAAARSRPSDQPPAAAPPLLAPTGSPGLNAVIDVVNSTAAPFQNAPPPEQGAAGVVAQGLGGVLGVVGAPTQIIDTAFATLTAPIAALFPAMPAITLLGMHVGVPHAHSHPPSLIPPAPPVPLPSIGMLVGAGSVTVLLGGLPAARAGDIGISVTCGSLAPPFEVFTGSSNVFIGGARAARVLDITKHCNPTSMGPFAIAMGAAGVVAGAAGALATRNIFAAAQAAADAAVLAFKILCGKDPGIPPGMGTLLGPPVPNVLIGGFPCPPIGEMAFGAILKVLAKAMRSLKGAVSRRGNGHCGEGSHPIYLVTGENFDSFVDFVSPGLFQWRRHYTSARARSDGPLGHGWRHFYQRSLSVRLHRATFTDWDGVPIEFPRFEPGTDRTRAAGYVLHRVARGHYRLSYRNDAVMEFMGGEFDGDLPLTRLETSDREVIFAYDSLGRLGVALDRSRKNADDQQQYEFRYDEASHLVQLVQVPIDNSRSAIGAGRAASIGRMADPSMRVSPPTGRLEAPEPVARAQYVYDYSETGPNLAQAQDAMGGVWSYEYDAFHRLTKQSDPRRYAYTFKYDIHGRCVEASGQDGLWWAKVEYFPEERFTRYTEGDNATWEYHYDSDGFITKIVDPYGGVKLRERDGQGRLACETDSGGRALRWLYDANDAHFARVDRFGNLFPPELEMPRLPNPFARQLPSTALGRLFEGVVPPSREAMLGVDEQLFFTLPPEAAIRARTCFRVRSSALGRGEPLPSLEAHIERDAMGRTTRETDPIGRVRTWTYDETGNVVARRDRDGRVSTQPTTSWNLVGERRDPLGNAMQYRYSRLEQIVGITDPLGNTTQYDYDLKERLIRVHENGRLLDEYVYDAGDHFVEKRDGKGAVVFTNEIHANHFVAVRHLASGGIHRFDYDERGRITEASTEKHEVRLAYDAKGLVLRDVRDGKGIERAHDDGALVTRIFEKFELRSGLTPDGSLELVDSAGKRTTLKYDTTGRVERRCSNGTVEVLQYDDEGRLEGRLVHKLDWAWRRTAWTVRYTYTADGDLVQIDDSARGVTKYEVDAAHRLIGETTPKNERHTFWQDPAGNLRSKPGMSTIDPGPGNRLIGSTTEVFEYDDRDRLVERRHRDGSLVRYTYDSFDMLVRVERVGLDGVTRLTWEAEYDAIGRRVRCSWRVFDDSFAHDAGFDDVSPSTRRGQTNEVALPKADGQREFYWDRDRLAAELLPDGRLRIYQYASREALVPLVFIEYDSVDADPGSGRSYQVFSDQVGMPVSIEDEERRVVWRAARIDPFGTISVEPDARLEYNPRWPGHYFDVETGLQYNRYRYYDPSLGRYLQSDPIGHKGSPVNLYAYCANPLVQVDVLGLAHTGRTDGSDGARDSGDGPDGRRAPPSDENTARTSTSPRPVIDENIGRNLPPEEAARIMHERTRGYVEGQAAIAERRAAARDAQGSRGRQVRDADRAAADEVQRTGRRVGEANRDRSATDADRAAAREAHDNANRQREQTQRDLAEFNEQQRNAPPPEPMDGTPGAVYEPAYDPETGRMVVVPSGAERASPRVETSPPDPRAGTRPGHCGMPRAAGVLADDAAANGRPPPNIQTPEGGYSFRNDGRVEHVQRCGNCENIANNPNNNISTVGGLPEGVPEGVPPGQRTPLSGAGTGG